jgi:hypothetical protein
MWTRRLVLPFSLVLGAIFAAHAQTPANNDFTAFLQSGGRFTPEEIASLDRGTVISKALTSDSNAEAFIVAATRIPSARPRVVAYVQQLISYVDGDVTQGFGMFSTPPRPEDAANLMLDQSDLDALRTCRPKDCDFRVGSGAAQTVTAAVDWKSAHAAERANALVREKLAAYAADYQRRGDEALVVYNDKSAAVSLAGEWRGIIANSPALPKFAPALQRHLTGYPTASLPDAKDSIYWDRQKLTGLKPTVGVTHLTVWTDPAHPDRTFVVQKQIYASHYFYGSLAVTAVADVPGDPAHGSYVLYSNRARGDLLKGGFGGLKRKAAESAIRSSAESMLTSIKQALAAAP